MTELRMLKLVCRNCGSRERKVYIVHEARRVSEFLAGVPIEQFREAS